MECYEATKSVLSKLHTIDPENASKIMGYVLLRFGDEDIIRLAHGPESVVVSIANSFKTEFGLSSNTLSAPLVKHISNPISISRPNPLSLPLSSPRLGSNGFNPSSPSSSSIWSSVSPNSGNHHSVSYASLIGSPRVDDSHLHEQSVPFGSNPLAISSKSGDFFEHGMDLGLSSGCRNDSVVYPYWENSNAAENQPHFHRRSSSDGFFGFDRCPDELLRSKIANQQRLAAHLMVRDAQRSELISEELYKLNRARIARQELMRGDSNAGSRQIYLTFPADSTFREEDVSEYFSLFGPVQDVRIPYQQKRMFGFVTFVYSETVNMILAKRNPHFVCDSRVLVKPYKEKGKLIDKRQQQMERGDFSCSSPSGLDCREPFEFPIGGRRFGSPEDMFLKRKIEEQALELQGRRLMNLQILDMKNHQHQQNFPIGSPILSPNLYNGINHDASEEDKGIPTEICDQQLAEGVNGGQCDSNGNVQNNEDNPANDESELPNSLEHILPDSLFASPTKPSSGKSSVFSSAMVELDVGDSSSSPLNMAPHKSCFFEMPRLSCGHGALGM